MLQFGARRALAQTFLRQIDLLRDQRINAGDDKDNGLDPEPGIDPFDLLGEQADEMLGIACRGCGADSDLGKSAINAIKGQLEPPRALRSRSSA